MEAKKVIEVVDRYDNMMGMIGAEVKRAPVDQLFPFAQSPVFAKNTVMAHVRWMCAMTREFATSDPPRIEKAFRWLGFIQGAMWLLGIYTVDDLANHSRPDDKEKCVLCQGNRVTETGPCPRCIAGEDRV